MVNKTALILTVTTLTAFGSTFFYLKSTDKTVKNETQETVSTSLNTAVIDKVDSIPENKSKGATKKVQTQTDLFKSAFIEIKNMLEGKEKMNFKRAVFLVDNA